MTITETAPADAVVPTFKAEKPRRSNTGLIVGIIVGGLLLMMILPVAAVLALRAGDSISQSDSGEIAVDDATVVDPVAYKYFGETELAQGTRVNSVIPGELVQTTDDVRILFMPGDGFSAQILDGGPDGIQLELEVPTDYTPGVYSIIFAINGEPETVTWAFTVLPR